MKNVVLDEFLNQRIEENKILFSRKELEVIKANKKVIRKIYILGAVNFYNC